MKELEWTLECLGGGTENLELAMTPSSSTSLPYFLKFPRGRSVETDLVVALQTNIWLFHACLVNKIKALWENNKVP